jgi:hypothetical protein
MKHWGGNRKNGMQQETKRTSALSSQNKNSKCRKKNCPRTHGGPFLMPTVENGCYVAGRANLLQHFKNEIDEKVESGAESHDFREGTT